MVALDVGVLQQRGLHHVVVLGAAGGERRHVLRKAGDDPAQVGHHAGELVLGQAAGLDVLQHRMRQCGGGDRLQDVVLEVSQPVGLDVDEVGGVYVLGYGSHRSTPPDEAVTGSDQRRRVCRT
jgi:hypothetical protein